MNEFGSGFFSLFHPRLSYLQKHFFLSAHITNWDIFILLSFFIAYDNHMRDEFLSQFYKFNKVDKFDGIRRSAFDRFLLTELVWNELNRITKLMRKFFRTQIICIRIFLRLSIFLFFIWFQFICVCLKSESSDEF